MCYGCVDLNQVHITSVEEIQCADDTSFLLVLVLCTSTFSQNFADGEDSSSMFGDTEITIIIPVVVLFVCAIIQIVIIIIIVLWRRKHKG